MAKWWKAPVGYQKPLDVLNLQNDVLSIVSGQMHSFSGKKSLPIQLFEAVRQQELQSLYTLRDYYLQEEDALFADFGAGIGSYKDLLERVKIWNEGNNGQSIFYKVCQNQQLIETIQELLNSDLMVDLAVVANEFSSSIEVDDLEDLVGATISDVIKECVGNLTKVAATGFEYDPTSTKWKTPFLTLNITYPKSKFLDVRAGGKIATSGGISLIKNKDGTLKISFTKNISVDERRKLAEKIYKYYDEEAKESKRISGYLDRSTVYGSIKELVMKKFKEAGMKSGPLASVDAVFQNNFIDASNITVNRNLSVIRGMLGEIYWSAFFHYIFKDESIKASPVGASLRNLAGQETPTDIVYKGMGFQIKNYTVNELGEVVFHQHYSHAAQEMHSNHESLFHLFNNVLDEAENARRFGKFYFSYQYNQVLKDEESAIKYYQPIYNRFEPIRENGIIPYIRANMPKLLNMNKDVLLEDMDLISEKRVGRPVLFIINDMPYPSSVIVQGVIDNLLNEDESSITFNLEKFEVEDKNFFGKSMNRGEYKFPDPVPKVDVDQPLKRIQIYYTISIDLSKLMQRILDMKG